MLNLQSPYKLCFCLQIKVSVETAVDPDACLVHNTSQPYKMLCIKGWKLLFGLLSTLTFRRGGIVLWLRHLAGIEMTWVQFQTLLQTPCIPLHK